METVVFHGLSDIRLDEVPEPKIEQPMDAIKDNQVGAKWKLYQESSPITAIFN